MAIEIFIDPYTLTNPPLESGLDRYLQFVENLLDWEDIFYEKNITTYLHSEILEALFALGLYPLHETLKESHNKFDVHHISIDSVNKIITSFINKSITFDCEFDYLAIENSPIHNQHGEQVLLDNILDNIYGYMLMNNSFCISQGLFSPFFANATTIVSANITYGICELPIIYPVITSAEIEVFQNYDHTMERCALIDLEESVVEPKKKKIKLSGTHHGNSFLRRFAKKLFHSPYVVAVINNSAFVPSARNIIHEIHEDGKIRIVLSDTDEGFSMVIQTTGTNLFQTQRIADILLQKFNDKQ